LIVVDECHHMPAVSFKAVIKRASVRHVLGLTATPYRRDGLQDITTMPYLVRSPRTSRISHGEMMLRIDGNRLTDVKCPAYLTIPIVDGYRSRRT
jgi:hypothetical protein